MFVVFAPQTIDDFAIFKEMEMKRSILGLFLLIGIANAEFIRDDSKEVVTDTRTKLMWQDDSDAKTQKSWSEAIDYCENLTLGGYDDWHLPNRNELSSLADRSRDRPTIDPGFQNVVGWYYWSSTTRAGDTSRAWDVSFHHGGFGSGDKLKPHYVRCVRSTDD